MKSLTDLDEAISIIPDPAVRIYAREAVDAYRAGALRAAIASIWVAVCSDVIEKIRFLASLEEAAAVEIERILLKARDEQDIRAMLDFENKVLEYAYDRLELISAHEKLILSRIKDDRNYSVHPSMSLSEGVQEITPELVRSHIISACTSMLCIPATVGKAVINTTFDLISQESFPATVDDAYQTLTSRSHLEKAKDSAVRGIANLILKRLFTNEERIPHPQLTRLVSALGALERIKPAVVRDLLSQKLSPMVSAKGDWAIGRLIAVLSILPENWNRVEVGVRVRVRTYCVEADLDSIRRFFLVPAAGNVPDLQDVVYANVMSQVRAEAVDLIKPHPSAFSARIALNALADSSSFDEARLTAEAVVGPNIKFVDSGIFDEFLGSIFECQRGHYNQVLDAGYSGQFFGRFAAETLSANSVKGDQWVAFYRKADAEGSVLPELEGVLAEIGLIESAADNDLVEE